MKKKSKVQETGSGKNDKWRIKERLAGATEVDKEEAVDGKRKRVEEDEGGNIDLGDYPDGEHKAKSGHKRKRRRRGAGVAQITEQ